MRKILILLMIMSVAYGQDTTKYFISKDYGWQWKRGKFDSSLMLPKDTTRNKLGIAQIGSTLYTYVNSKWNSLTGLSASDTAAMLSKYARKIYVDSAINANIPIYDLQDVTNAGATTTNDVTVNNLSAKSLFVTGTNGNGHIYLKHQNSDATATGQTTALFANSSGYLKWKNDGNYYSTLAMPQTANRVYTFQDKNYTLADNADLASKLNVSDTANMLSPYLRSSTATATYATITNLALKVNIADTSTMLTPYLRKIDTANLSNRINTKGSGTVTNVLTTNGLGITSSVLNGTTTPNITIAVDTSNTSILSRQRAANTYAPISINGTVTSIATGYGLSGGTITSTGTLLVDSATLGAKYSRLSSNNTFTGLNTISTSQTASSGVAKGTNINNTLVAAANSDMLIGLDLSNTYTRGAFTGVGDADIRTSRWAEFATTNSLGIIIGAAAWSGNVPTSHYRLTFDNGTGQAKYNAGNGGGFYHDFQNNSVSKLRVNDANVGITDKLYIGSSSTTATALLHLKAGTSTANTAPIKFTSGTNLSTVENGTIEYDGTDYFASANSARQKIQKGLNGSFSGTGTSTTTFTVTFGGTQPNATYKVVVTPTNALTSALFYVTSKTTTSFAVTFLSALTGTVAFDWVLIQ